MVNHWNQVFRPEGAIAEGLTPIFETPHGMPAIWSANLQSAWGSQGPRKPIQNRRSESESVKLIRKIRGSILSAKAGRALVFVANWRGRRDFTEDLAVTARREAWFF